MSRIVVSSDWHTDHTTYGVVRYRDVRDAILQTVDAAIEMRADLYLFTGDLCDPDDGPAALQGAGFVVSVATRLAARGIPFWAIAGNHDVIEDGTGATTLSILQSLGMPEIQVFELPCCVTVPGRSKELDGRPVPMLVLPYTAASRRYDPREVVAEHADALGKRAIVAGHLTLDGITPGEETNEMPKGRNVSFPVESCRPGWLMVNGHYHERQVYRGVQIPGAPARLTFGEVFNKPSYLVIEV